MEQTQDRTPHRHEWQTVSLDLCACGVIAGSHKALVALEGALAAKSLAAKSRAAKSRAGEGMTDGAIAREVAAALRMFVAGDGEALRACLKRRQPETVDRALRRAANMTDLADADLARIDASGEPPF